MVKKSVKRLKIDYKGVIVRYIERADFMAYNKKAQKKYNEKCKRYTIKYTPDEMDIVSELENIVKQCDLTMNAWIKNAIHEKLERETKKEESRTD